MIKAALLASVCLLPWAAFFFRNNKLWFALLSLLDLSGFILLLILKINILYCFFFLAAAVLINTALLSAASFKTSETKPFNFIVLIIVLLCAGGAGYFVYQAGTGPVKTFAAPAWEAGLGLVCAALIFFAGFYAVKKGEQE